MVRRFFRDSVIYAFPAAASAGMALITFPLFAHHFHPSDYGIIELLTLANVLAILLVDVEIYQAVGRYVIAEKDPEAARSYASTGLLWSLSCYLVLTVVVLGLAGPIRSLLLGSQGAASLVRIALLWTVAQGLLNQTQSQLRWNMNAWGYTSAGTLNAVLSAAAALVFVFVAHLGVAGVLWGYATGSLCALALVAVLTKGMFRLTFDRARLRQMLDYSAPLVLSNAGVFLNLFADRLVIQHLRSVADVGIYAVGNRVAMVIALLLTGFLGAATPLFLSQHEDPETPEQMARIFRLFAALACVMFLALSLFATPLVRILSAPAYQSAATVVPLLVVATLFANIYMFAPGLMIAKRTRTMAKVTLTAGVANLVLALALVPPLGIVGAGIATALSSAGWFVALMYASQRHYPVPHTFSRLLAAGAAAGCVAGVCFATLPLARSEALRLWTLGARFGLLLAGGLLCVWLCLDASDLRRFLRRLTRGDPTHTLSDAGDGPHAPELSERQMA